MTRWFAKVEMDGTPRALFRMDIDDHAKTLDCRLWNRSEGAWVDDNALVMRYLSGGDPLFDEISEQQAREFAPEAFAAP